MTYAPVENFLHVMKDEIPRRLNPLTGEVRTTEWDYERDGPDPLEGFGTIGPYRPEIDKSEILPLVDIVSNLFNTARGRDVNKRDYDNLEKKYKEEYDEYMNPKGPDPFAPSPIRLAGVPYTLPMQKLFYKGGDGKVKSMTSPLNFRSNEDTWQRHLMRYPLASNPVGDSQPIRPFETNRGIEYMPVPYGPVQNLPTAQTDLEDIMFAGAPRFIQSSPPPNIINKAPHIDSPFMDRWYKERELLRGPQLFPLA